MESTGVCHVIWHTLVLDKNVLYVKEEELKISKEKQILKGDNMGTDVTKIKQLLKLAEDKDRQGRILRSEASALIETAQKQCTHPVVENDEQYDDGSYLDRASTTKTTKCAICGKQLDCKTKQHPWYG